MKFTFEADLARKGLIDYNTAIQRTYLTRTRFQLAKPYSVIVLGHEYGWYYGDDGLLVYPLGDLIRILDVYNAAVTEDVIDVRSLLSEEAERWHPHTQGIEELLSRDLDLDIVAEDYREGLLLLLIKSFDSSSRYLVVINIRKGVPLQERLLMIRWYSSDCAAKTDGRYIVVSKDFERFDNLDLYDLEDKQQCIQKLCLPGCTNLFMEDCQLYDGWFNLLSRDNENYHYYLSFPLKQSHPVTAHDAAGTELLPEQLQVVRVKRRQPRTLQNRGSEPNDCWPSLRLCRDEYSGQLSIVEAWVNGKKDHASKPPCTFQPLHIPEPNSAIGTATPDRDFNFNSGLQTLNPEDLPLGEKIWDCPTDPGNRLKARSYNPRASTFLDIYLGSDANLDSAKESEFHLAVGSCNRASPSESESGQLDKISSEKLGAVSPNDYNGRQCVRMRRFPPDGAPKALFDLLCPTGKMKRPTMSVDDPRSILCSTKRLHRRLNDKLEQLVLINFDPYIRFPGLDPMVLHPLSTQLTSKEYDKELARAKNDKPFLWEELSDEEYEAKANKIAAKQSKIDEMNRAERAGKVWEPRSEWFWTERAMYLDIGQGFQFS